MTNTVVLAPSFKLIGVLEFYSGRFFQPERVLWGGLVGPPLIEIVLFLGDPLSLEAIIK